ncbi:MAG: DUF1315 family protein [Alcanivorax sp.]|nr:DUF1315 family protein [Alcanivorax sp.]
MSYQSFDELIASMTPEIYHNMRRALELGKWPDGRTLTAEQKELCMQAVIAWENRHLPEQERTGYMEQACKSQSMEDQEQPVTLKGPDTLQ